VRLRWWENSGSFLSTIDRLIVVNSLLCAVQGLLLDTLLLCMGILQSRCSAWFKAFSWIPCCFAQGFFNLVASCGSRPFPGYPAALHGNPSISLLRAVQGFLLDTLLLCAGILRSLPTEHTELLGYNDGHSLLAHLDVRWL